MDSGMYTEREVQCVKEGMGAVRSVLSGTDTEAKRRLLFYLDWYMDPYYRQDISDIKNDLKEMLEKVVVSPNEEDVIDEALHLLEGYTDPPYPILAAYLGNLGENINRKRFIWCRKQNREFRQNRGKGRDQK